MERYEQILTPRKIVIGTLGVLSAIGIANPTDTQATNPVNHQARCENQTKKDPESFNSCQYKVVLKNLVKTHPSWVKSHHLPRPGHEDANDRKIIYFKTHPKAYQLHKDKIAAGVNYNSPIKWLWNYVRSTECNQHGTGKAPAYWDCETGNGYHGGLQMDRTFEATYNPNAYKLWGHAGNWPINAQMLAADRAYSSRGLQPWPTAHSRKGTYPVAKFKDKKT